MDVVIAVVVVVDVEGDDCIEGNTISVAVEGGGVAIFESDDDELTAIL